MVSVTLPEGTSTKTVGVRVLRALSEAVYTLRNSGHVGKTYVSDRGSRAVHHYVVEQNGDGAPLVVARYQPGSRTLTVLTHKIDPAGARYHALQVTARYAAQLVADEFGVSGG